MKAHIAVLGFVFSILGALQLLGGTLFGVFGVGGGMLTWLGGGDGSGFAGAFIGMLGVGIAMVILFWGGLTALTGWGLLTRRHWGRWLGVILCVINVASFSWLSLFGLYGLWALLGNGSTEVFRNKL